MLATILSLLLTLQSPPHVAVQLDAVVWRGQAGALQTAIAEGNPQAAGTFTMLLKLPDGVWIPPHFHNVDKRLVVIKGELLMGHGDKIDATSAIALEVGGVAVMPANTHHYEGGKGETIVALIANGPFTTTMVPEGGTPPARSASTTPAATTAAVGATGGRCTSANEPAAVASVRAAAEGIIAADNARAIERVLAAYAEDATLWPPNEAPVTGRAAIRARYESLFAASQPKLTTTIDSICADAHLAVVEGRNGGSFEPLSGGSPRTVADRYVMALGLGADGAWHIVHLAWRSTR